MGEPAAQRQVMMQSTLAIATVSAESTATAAVAVIVVEN